MRSRVIFLLAIFALLFFRFFISIHPFVAHDWPLLFSQSRNFFPFFNISWDYIGAGGIGGSAFKTLWIDLYTNLVYAISNSVNLPWWMSQRIFWILPFILISLLSSYVFSGLFIKKDFLRGISSIIYTFNTYILLIIGGGQFGIAFAYGLLPLALYCQLKFFEKSDKKTFVQSSLISGIILALDPRIAILGFITAFFWYLTFVRDFSFRKIKFIVLSLVAVFFLNSYWILPILLTPGSLSSVSQYSSILGVKFLSFANFSNSFSLLHPNWPENIFGKIYFFRPEFLVIPLFAFSILLFKNSREILFFAVLALAAAFLGKGANDPFGQVYSFLFNLPIFGLFRDSTKFFVLIALSYSVLIPVFLEKLKKFKALGIFLFIICWLLILKPAWSGQLNGIFQPKSMPQEYIQFNKKLTEDKSFYRTLWIPQREKYGYFDPNHPAIDAQDFLNQTNYQKLIGKFGTSKVQKLLEEASVRYVIIPDDIDSEIFLKDRKYDETQYKKAINELGKISWLKKVQAYGKIKVYETNFYRDHFWSPTLSAVSYNELNPTEYKVNVKNSKKGDLLVFSEGFDRNWQASVDGSRVKSEPFALRFNSFRLPKSGNYELDISYQPQKWVNIGLTLSLLTFFCLILSTFMLFYSNGRAKRRSDSKSRS